MLNSNARLYSCLAITNRLPTTFANKNSFPTTWTHQATALARRPAPTRDRRSAREDAAREVTAQHARPLPANTASFFPRIRHAIASLPNRDPATGDWACPPPRAWKTHAPTAFLPASRTSPSAPHRRRLWTIVSVALHPSRWPHCRAVPLIRRRSLPRISALHH
jgi:hypothetical protein